MRYCIDRAQPRVDAPPEDGCVGTRMTRRYVRELRKAACLTTARLLDVRWMPYMCLVALRVPRRWRWAGWSLAVSPAHPSDVLRIRELRHCAHFCGLVPELLPPSFADGAILTA